MNHKLLFVLPLVVLATGCANLARNLNDPAVWERIGQITDRAADRQYEIQTGDYGPQQLIDLTGEWTFTHKGQLNTNRIVHGDGGIMVMPIGRANKPVFYVEAGPNFYVSGPSSYDFSTVHTGVWNSGRGLVLHLRRATFQ